VLPIFWILQEKESESEDDGKLREK